MNNEEEITIRGFVDFNPGELFAIIRHIYLTTDFMSDDFDRKFSGVIQFEKYYKNVLNHAGSFFLIALIDERPVGYLIVEPNAASRLQHTANLTMGIVENQRKKGIGRQLLKAALEKANQQKVLEIIYLMVRADHVGAVKLYESAGFEKLTRLEKDTKIGSSYFDGILMRKFI